MHEGKEERRRRRKKKKKKKEQEEEGKRRRTKLKFSCSIFSTLRRRNGTLGYIVHKNS